MNQNNNIIIISGAAGTGKTVLARSIQKSIAIYGYQIIEEFSIKEIQEATKNAIQNEDACIFTTQQSAEHFKGKGAMVISITY